jgi:hypothetical protein
MKKIAAAFLSLVLLFSFALAEEVIRLPNSRYVLTIPDGMKHSAPGGVYGDVEAWYSDTLEMDVQAMLRADAVRNGMPETLRESAEEWAALGVEAELRKVAGIEMLCFRVTDPTDETPSVNYVLEDGDWIIEIDFWYATQEAADLTVQIISSIREE